MKLFISYSNEDEAFVRRLEADLRAESGLETWLDRMQINPGDMIPEKIGQGISDADVFLLVLSPDSVGSRWVGYEWQAWLALQVDEEKRAKEEGRPPGRRLIPVLYRNCDVPTFLASVRYVRISDVAYRAGFEELVGALGTTPQGQRSEKEPTAARIPEPGPPRRKYVLTLLKALLPAQFEEVVLVYDAPAAYIPTQVAQAQQAVALIRYGEQCEGKDLSHLLSTILEVAPQRKRNR